MVVKYYGRPRWNPETGEVEALASILTFNKLCTRTLDDGRGSERSACMWLVPGTFDLEGRHVE
jgi:hypothetical protein